MLYDVGGRRLFLETAGAGRPTVVLEAGAGQSGSTWDPIWSALADFTLVCRYDRPNLGSSDRDATLRTVGDVARDLHRLLQAAAVPGPYVMVGHSFGGLVVRLYAHAYPQEVAGVVLVDSSHPEQYKRSLGVLPPPAPTEQPEITAVRSRYGDPDTPLPEGINFGRTLAQVRECGDLGRIPTVVLSRARPTSPDALQQVRPGLPPEIAGALEALWQELQADLAALSADCRHRVADQSGHFIHRDQPALVLEAIRDVVRKARTRLP